MNQAFNPIKIRARERERIFRFMNECAAVEEEEEEEG